MRSTKRTKLEKGGYRLTDTKELLNLSTDEIALIDLKISLIKRLREARTTAGLTQKELAKLMNSSQSRIAMLEGGSPDISLELICRALFSLGLSHKDLGKLISGVRAA
jgi:DNA-binding XRE family transcriptional regulator